MLEHVPTPAPRQAIGISVTEEGEAVQSKNSQESSAQDSAVSTMHTPVPIRLSQDQGGSGSQLNPNQVNTTFFQ